MSVPTPEPTKHAPERTCVGCRTKRPKPELLRVTFNRMTNSVQFDSRQRLPGRGAYVCSEPACWQAGLSRGGFDRTLKTKLPATTRQELLRVFTMGVE